MIKTGKISSKYIILINTLLLLTVSICLYPAMAQVSADSLATLLNEAYAIMQTNPDRAEQLFEQALKIAPNDLALHRQLGYLYSEHNKSEQALIEFKHAEAIQPSDTIKLQMAFILVSLGREDEAVTALRELSGSRDENIKKSADAQLATISSPVDEVSPEPSNWYSRIYAAPYSDTRWNTIFYNLDAEHGYYFDRNKMFFSYGFLSFSTDSKSKLGEVPLIFSDNAVIGGVGLGIKPLSGLELRSQLGIAYDVVQQDIGAARWREDFRALVIYGNGIYPNFEFHDNVKMTFEPLLDVYSSVGYYSRYKNTIGYLQVRAGLRVFEMACSAADIYIRSMFVQDSKSSRNDESDLWREPYNNFLDFGVGLRILPINSWDLYIMLESYYGIYHYRSLIRQDKYHIDDYGHTVYLREKEFSGFRLFIIYDHIF